MVRSFGWMNSETDWGHHLAPKSRNGNRQLQETVEVGPQVFHGVVRRLAYEERKKQKQSYLRVFFCNSGRRGYSGYGGLGLEINGEIFRFTAGVKRYPDFHDGAGQLTAEGEQALVNGVSGFLTDHCDWHWVHLENNLQIEDRAIEQIAAYYRGLHRGEIALPTFQTCPKALGNHNCTTIILEQIGRATGISINEPRPFQGMCLLQMRIGTFYSEIDGVLNPILDLTEKRLGELLSVLFKSYGEFFNWRRIAKGQDSVPEWLSLDMLRQQ